MRETIYIVDDEPHIRQLLALGLAEQGFRVCAFEMGEAFLRAVEERIPDAAVLDWMMPPPDGLELCGMLRADPRTRAVPLLLLTARNGEADRVLGLEQGADDYLGKPFSIRELAARLRALLRREEYLAQGKRAYLRCGDLVLDEEGREVRLGGQTVPLAAREFDLLGALLRNCGRVLTREVLLHCVWGGMYPGDTRTVDVHIRYLRQKLAGSKNVRIETARGMGYRLVCLEQRERG